MKFEITPDFAVKIINAFGKLNPWIQLSIIIAIVIVTCVTILKK